MAKGELPEDIREKIENWIASGETGQSLTEYVYHLRDEEVNNLRIHNSMLNDENDGFRKLVDEQQQTINELLQGLEKIVSPVKFMQIDAEKEGYHLNGMMAIQLSKDPNYLQEIAKNLLSKYKGE
jgi:predicted nuclease with TOPRIM domain